MAEQPDPDDGSEETAPTAGDVQTSEESSAPDPDDDHETGPNTDQDGGTGSSDGSGRNADSDTSTDDDSDTSTDNDTSSDTNTHDESADVPEFRPPDSAAADGGTGASVAGDEPAVTSDTVGGQEPAVIDEGLAGEGPESDEEMPLTQHIEEMMRRLSMVFLIGGIALLVVYPFASELINYLWSVHIPSPVENRPRLYGPLELLLTKLKVAGLAGVLVGLPMFVYQSYRFMKPGLYPTERRYYLASVPTSLVLGIVGVLFAHFLVLPFVFSYFTTYTSDAAVIAFGLQETFNLILIMMGWMAIIFQIPLFIMLAIMMGLVTRRWLESKRLLFWGAFLGIAFVFSPDPTGMAPIIVTLTMIGLFEGTLALLRWTGN